MLLTSPSPACTPSYPYRCRQRPVSTDRHRHRRINRLSAVENQESARTDSTSELIGEVDRLLEGLTNGTASADTLQPSQAAPPPGYQLQCDVSGCSIVKVAEEEAAQGLNSPPRAEHGPRDFEMAEGHGWKLGFDKSPSGQDQFSALLGGDAWTMELSQKEYGDFVQLLHNLRRSVATLQICGDWGASDGQDATLELSNESLWMQGRAPQKRLTVLQELWNRGLNNAKGPDAAFSLRFIVLTPGQREVEGRWSAEAVMDVLRHLDAASQDSPLKSSREAFAKSASYA
ncbi:hypothetical protein WJX73_010272 [Symbiochloris irregularis]|uniref:Uncharacterized protein n=1 Tax=Symbiochloris irregularis TaxID=706552 RepID=A0AAW1NR01_9CHLO